MLNVDQLKKLLTFEGIILNNPDTMTVENQPAGNSNGVAAFFR